MLSEIRTMTGVYSGSIKPQSGMAVSVGVVSHKMHFIPKDKAHPLVGYVDRTWSNGKEIWIVVVLAYHTFVTTAYDKKAKYPLNANLFINDECLLTTARPSEDSEPYGVVINYDSGDLTFVQT